MFTEIEKLTYRQLSNDSYSTETVNSTRDHFKIFINLYKDLLIEYSGIFYF